MGEDPAGIATAGEGREALSILVELGAAVGSAAVGDEAARSVGWDGGQEGMCKLWERCKELTWV